LDFTELLARVRLLKKEFNISPVKQSNEKNRRRITILIVDEFLKAEGDIHQAFYLEANLYQVLRKAQLKCDPTPEEIRLRELERSKRQRLKGFSPLRLVSENAYLPYKKTYPITKAIMKILTEKENINGFSGDNIRRRTSQTFKHLQKDTRLFKKQKGTSLYRAD